MKILFSEGTTAQGSTYRFRCYLSQGVIREGCERVWDRLFAGPGARPELHTKAFWDKYYASQETLEWYVDAETAGAAILDTLDSEATQRSVLHVGAGTSSLGVWLGEQLGPQTQVVNVDICSTAVKAMRRKYPHQKWILTEALDRTDFGFAEEFDLVIDKGCLDAVISGGARDTAKFLYGCVKHMAQRGMLLQISADPPDNRLELLRAAFPLSYGWEIKWKSNIGSAYEMNGDHDHHVYSISKK